MVRVPEALKEVVQKLAEIHRQGDKRREVEAGLHRLLAELIDSRDESEQQEPEPEPATTVNALEKAPADDVTADIAADIAADKIDSKTASTSVVMSDSINVEEVVNRLAILEEKLAALEPQTRTDASADDTADSTADDKADSSTNATQG